MTFGPEVGDTLLPAPGTHTPGIRFGPRRRKLLVQVVALAGAVFLGLSWYGVIDAPVWADRLEVTQETAADSVSSQTKEELVHSGEESPSPTHTSPSFTQIDLSPTAPIQTWGLDLSSDKLLAGLAPWPENPPYDAENTAPLSSLGHFADNIYKIGPITLAEYHARLTEFASVAFPDKIKQKLLQSLSAALSTTSEDSKTRSFLASWRSVKKIWQTDKDSSLKDSAEVQSWRRGKAFDEGWDWSLMTDNDAEAYVQKHLRGSRMEIMWNALPTGILKSDVLRYLLLLLEGGIYTDTDTNLLKPPSVWGAGAKLWRNGAGWLSSDSLDRIDKGETQISVLGEPSVVVGIEADVGDRSDWFDWWPRPMQIVQWTMASRPHHPIALSALLRVLHSTAQSVDWAHEHAFNIKSLKELNRYKDAKALLDTTVLMEPTQGGSVGVMAWTGPGVWTDAVLSYLRVQYGLLWIDLRGLKEPLRVGDVVILPVTGFSPGVKNFGAQESWDHQAMVEHNFRGSWKHKPGDKGN